MPKKNPFFNIANRNQVLLERLKEGYSRRMISELNAAVKKTEDFIKGLDVDTLDEVPLKEMQGQLRKLREAETGMMFEAVNRQVEDFGLLTEQQIVAEGEVLGSLLKPGNLVAPVSPVKAFASVLQTPLGVNGQMLKPFMQGWAEGAVNRVNDAVMKGWQEGKTVQQMARTIRGSRSRQFKDGLVAIEARHAKTVVRTSTQHVANAARQELYAANPELVKSYRFIATLDTRTSAKCRELDRQVFLVGKGPLPPQHPNCRSTTIPELGPMFDVFDQGATRSSAEGYVDANENYYSWLKKQDAAFQDTALGAKRGKLFRDGGLTERQFRDLQLGSNFEPLTLDDMRKIAPDAFKAAGI